MEKTLLYLKKGPMFASAPHETFFTFHQGQKHTIQTFFRSIFKMEHMPSLFYIKGRNPLGPYAIHASVSCKHKDTLSYLITIRI